MHDLLHAKTVIVLVGDDTINKVLNMQESIAATLNWVLGQSNESCRESMRSNASCADKSGKAYTDKLVLIKSTKEVFLNGHRIELTATEYRILECLLVNGPNLLSKDVLAEAAFPHEPVPNVDVESHIKNIRRKLGDKADQPRFIRLRRAFGYQAVQDSYIILNEPQD